jgi:hypothetical protein
VTRLFCYKFLVEVPAVYHIPSFLAQRKKSYLPDNFWSNFPSRRLARNASDRIMIHHEEHLRIMTSSRRRFATPSAGLIREEGGRPRRLVTFSPIFILVSPCSGGLASSSRSDRGRIKCDDSEMYHGFREAALVIMRLESTCFPVRLSSTRTIFGCG